MILINFILIILFIRYYKKFNIPDMERIGLGLNSKNLSYSHVNNTLIISVSEFNFY